MATQAVTNFQLHKSEGGKGAFIFHTAKRCINCNVGEFKNPTQLVEHQAILPNLFPQLRHGVNFPWFCHGVGTIRLHSEFKKGGSTPRL